MHTHTRCAACDQPHTATASHPATHPGCEPVGIHAHAAEYERLMASDNLNPADLARAVALRTTLDDYDSRPPNLGRAAHAYAAWGWPVFPCRPGGKTPITTHGLHDATTDPERVHLWWSVHPHANIGLPTGHHFDVLDIDPAGHTWYLHALLAPEGEAQLPDVHGIVTTPRGTHLYLPPSGGGNLAGLAEGVDYRGLGGYVIAPPSRVDGQRYTWTSHPSPLITDTSTPATNTDAPATPGGTP